MSFFKWSRTAASNANSDSTVNWAEGQSPSSVNDSGRAMMAAAAKYRDDISGAIATGGTASAYTLSTYQTFASLTNLDGNLVAFTPHATNEASPTLNVDSLGAKALRSSTGEALPAGTLIEGTPYQALYSNSDSEFILLGFFGNPYNIPIAGGMDWWGTTVPNSNFVFPYGQAISRTTYATCFARMGTTYGVGDGSTTFNLPDKQGRVSAGKDDMGGTSANRLTNQSGGLNGDVLGATGGEQTHTLAINQLPVVTPAGTIVNTYANNNNIISSSADAATGPDTTQYTVPISLQRVSIGVNSTFTGTPFGGGAAHNNVQPTIVCNYIIRII